MMRLILVGLLLLVPRGAMIPDVIHESVFRDGALEVSPDGRFVLIAVRDRDTNGDGRITDRDGKSLLLLENDREIHRFGGGSFTWQDKMARWSPDGRAIAVVLPAPGAVLAATDLVLFDPMARREVARHAGGLNPFWLWDGRLGFQGGNEIHIVSGNRIDRVAPATALTTPGALIREIVVDPHRRRVVVSLASNADVTMRVAAGRRGSRTGWFVSLEEKDGAWRAAA